MITVSVCGIPEIPHFATRGITHAVSLLDAEFTDVVYVNGGTEVVHTGDHLFEGYSRNLERLEIQFDDVSSHTPWTTAPEQGDISRILQFAKSLPEEANLLVHCHAGLSRSTAAATIILAQYYPEKTIEEIFEMLISIRPQAMPNRLILEHGGQILGRLEEMKRAYNVRFSW